MSGAEQALAALRRVAAMPTGLCAPFAQNVAVAALVTISAICSAGWVSGAR